MILYNVTVIIDESVNREWLQWVREQHIPDVTIAGMFKSVRLLKVVDSPNEGITYCVQYVADSMENYTLYKQQFEDAFNADRDKRFKDSFVSFPTLMEFI